MSDQINRSGLQSRWDGESRCEAQSVMSNIKCEDRQSLVHHGLAMGTGSPVLSLILSLAPLIKAGNHRLHRSQKSEPVWGQTRMWKLRHGASSRMHQPAGYGPCTSYQPPEWRVAHQAALQHRDI